MTDFVKQLKEQINIADVVGEYVRLRKTGSNHMGLCPFHAERSASFSVSEKKGIYHCFGCQKGGDAISFIQEIMAVSFHEAVRILASKYGIKLPAEFARSQGGSTRGQSAEDRLEIYYKLNRFVAQFYHEKLLSPAGEVARGYLSERGITATTIKQAYLGYAPADWSELYEFLEQKKAPIQIAEELGLIRKKNTDSSGRSYYDLFRDRVMFPVIDLRGRVIAFGGRALGKADGPKYLNSTESPIYHKGSHLYGMFAAQKDIRAEEACIVVEGFMDCLSLQQAGIGHTVATLGTALTDKQVSLIKRFTKNITVLFDGDAAGKEAQLRAMEIFLHDDIVVRGVTLADEYDPDEFVKEKGAEELLRLLKAAPYLLDQQILELAAQAGLHSEERARAVDKVLPWIAQISSDTARLVRLQELSALFGMQFEVIDRKIQELRAKPIARPATAPVKVQSVAPALRKTPKAAMDKADALDLKLIEVLVLHPHLFTEIADRTGILDGLESEAARRLASVIFERFSLEVNGSPVADPQLVELAETDQLKAAFRKALIASEQGGNRDTTPEERQLLVTEIRDLEKKLVRRGLERRKDILRAELLKKEAIGSGQSVEVSRLMTQYNELVKRLDETKGGQPNL